MDKEKIKILRQVCANISVLYVEDDKDVSEQFEKLLRKIFVNVDIEKNGAEGLENYTKNRQDIVITDISMPIMDGIEMAKRIKQINGEQNIVVTSAHNDIEYLMHLINIGVEKFLLKPIDMNGFLTNISKIAMNIYREKREGMLEEKIKKAQDFKLEMLNSIIFPVAYFEEEKIVYANKAFLKHFLTKTDIQNLSRFRFGYLFDDKRCVSLSNFELIKKIDESGEKTKMILHVNEKTLKKYHINTLKLNGGDGILASFISLDAINQELDRFNVQTDYFPKRESFAQKIYEIRSDASNEYDLYCVGLKNKKIFIDKYGGNMMHGIYVNFAKCLKKEFAQEIAEGKMFIYLFETNRYVIVADRSIGESVDSKLENFGKNNFFDYGSSLPFNLKLAKDAIEKRRSVREIIGSSEGLLYTL